MNKIVKRPWGHYKVLSEGPGFKVKSIVVKPKQRLSLQKHQHRSEHWVVVRGIARVTLNEDCRDYEKGQYIIIPEKSLHRLENQGEKDIEIIEIQHGEYLEEDDIERFADDYNRK